MWFDSKYKINRSSSIHQSPSNKSKKKWKGHIIVDLADILIGRFNSAGKHFVRDILIIWSTLVFNRYEPNIIATSSFLKMMDTPEKAEDLVNKEFLNLHDHQEIEALKTQDKNLVLGKKQTKWDVKCEWKGNALVLR